MRAAAITALVLLTGCDPRSAEPGDDCQLAQEMFQDCGATVPLLTDGACTGLRSALAGCVLERPPSCDDLAALAERPDVCLPELAEVLGLDPPGTQPSNTIFDDPGARR